MESLPGLRDSASSRHAVSAVLSFDDRGLGPPDTPDLQLVHLAEASDGWYLPIFLSSIIPVVLTFDRREYSVHVGRLFRAFYNDAAT